MPINTHIHLLHNNYVSVRFTTAEDDDVEWQGQQSPRDVCRQDGNGR